MAERKVDVAIIGAGTAGLAAYRRVREHTERLVLIEGGAHGTTCARVGCMPSKLLIAAAEAAHAVHEAPVFGLEAGGPPRIDGRAVMSRVRALRDYFVDSVLEVVEDFPAEHRLAGHARFVDDHRLQVGEDVTVAAARIIIATGSRPTWPSSLDVGDLLATSDDVFAWQDLPESVAVFGGGIIGLELGQALHRLGVRMRLFGKGGAVGPLSDPKVREYAARTFTAEFAFDPDAKVRSVQRRDGKVEVTFEDEGGGERTERFDRLLAATGRRPNVDRLGLENTSLELDDKSVPLFDRFTGQSGDSHIFIAGDADDEVPLLHEAADEGKIAGDNAGRYPDVRAQTRRAPLGIVFSDPQIATVGKSYRELQAEEVDHAIGEVSFEDQGRSRVINRNRGLLRLYGAHGTGLFLGAEMIGPAAEHIAHLLAWAAQLGLSVHEMLALPYYHPVIEEGVRTGLRALNRQLRMGPDLVPQCLDCGPGA
ncbi:MAG TPA: dihydrolipoyl dehydrogenase [Geminicoccaceae bacterium]|nr:dihydrolipoyl dehydrogenase [Geminicoccaceae bacterium]